MALYVVEMPTMCTRNKLPIKDEKIVVAKSRSKIHPVFSMWKLELEPFLEEAIENGIRKIDDFVVIAEPSSPPQDPSPHPKPFC